MVTSVSAITPAPTDEEAAAIVAAVELLWPQPATIATPAGDESGWRMSGRWWRRDTTWPRRTY